MHSAAFFEAVRRLPLGSLTELTDGGPFLVLSPHPDDETLGTGGLISSASARGQDAYIALVTDGSASHPNSRRYPPAKLAELRRGEFEEAARILGVQPDRLILIGFPDSKAPDSGPEFEAAAIRLAEFAARNHIRSVFASWIGDPHCDHQATARLALAMRHLSPDLRLWAYPIWGWHLPPDAELDVPPPNGFALSIGRFAKQKRSALAAHRSQVSGLIDDDPEGFRLSHAHLKPFEGDLEFFLEVPR